LLVTSAQANETVCVVCANRLQKRGSSLVGEQLSTLHHDADMLAAISFVLQHCDELSSIDLHGLRASSAVMVAEWCTLHAAKQGLAVFTIITGRGSHSKGGSVLKPAVYNALVSSIFDAVFAATGTTLSCVKHDGSITVTLSNK
jgi:hypothetical protein